MPGSENRVAASGQGAPHQRRQGTGVRLETVGLRKKIQNTERLANRLVPACVAGAVLRGEPGHGSLLREQHGDWMEPFVI